MAKSLRISWVNLIDGATLSASSAATTLPVSKLTTEDIQDTWRATSTTAWILADLGGVFEIGMIALINSNAGLTDTAQFRVSTTDATGATGDAYDSGVIATAVDANDGMLIHPVEPAVTGRFVRVDLTQAAAPSAGRCFVGRAWEPSYHFSLVRGWQPLWRDLSRQSRSLGENLFYDRRPRQRGLRFVLRGLNTTEARTELHEINRLNGASRDILVCMDVDSATLGKDTFWGPMDAPIDYPQTEKNFFEAEFTMWNRL